MVMAFREKPNIKWGVSGGMTWCNKIGVARITTFSLSYNNWLWLWLPCLWSWKEKTTCPYNSDSLVFIRLYM